VFSILSSFGSFTIENLQRRLGSPVLLAGDPPGSS